MACCRAGSPKKKKSPARQTDQEQLIDLLYELDLRQLIELLQQHSWESDFLRTCLDICVDLKNWPFLAALVEGTTAESLPCVRDETFLRNVWSMTESDGFIVSLFHLIRSPDNRKAVDFMLFMAAEKSSPSVVEAAFKRNCDVNAMFKLATPPNNKATALHAAVLLGNRNISQKLLKHPDIDLSLTYGDDKKTLLHMACAQNRHEILKDILQFTSPPMTEAVDSTSGLTALQQAAIKGSAECVKILLDHGADVNSRHDGSTITPLMSAVSRSDLSVCELLVKHASCDVNARDTSSGMTALHRAADQGNVELVSLLLSRGADPNPVDWDLATPLSLAVNERHLTVAKILLPLIGGPDPLGNIVKMALDRDIDDSLMVAFQSLGANLSRVPSKFRPVLTLKCYCKIRIRRSLHTVRMDYVLQLGLPRDMSEYLYSINL